MGRPLPIGISDFKELIDGDYAYVDKTLLIEEIVKQGTKVALIPRPRRFGKTLNLSMLRYFFEKVEEDRSYLFKDLNIWKLKKYSEMQGQFPVIFITFKDIKHSSWEKAFEHFRILLSEEFERHRYLLEGDILSPEEKEAYNAILRQTGTQPLCEQSLRFLVKWLHLYHKKQIILLVDEYDTPAHAAYVGKYYDIMIEFLRNLLSGCLKDSTHLERGVVTGILRIAKESVFSGLNNIKTFTILNKEFQDKFGLTELEVKKLLEEYNLLDQWDSIRQWYNGYRIGSCEGIYNPWSVLNCISNKGELAPYWVNTSDNALMKELITQGSEYFKADIEELMKGGTIAKTIEEGIVFADLQNNPDVVWSLLLFSGYLSITTTSLYGQPCQLRIPNIEIRELYHSIILKWFKETIQEPKYQMLLQSLTSGDIATFSQIFQEFILSSFSFFDVPAEEPEKIYHAFVLGMLIGLKDHYEVKSNRESGYGRYDVMLVPKNPQDLGVVLEFKKIGRFEKTDLETAVTSALQQIEDRKYDLELKNRGVSRILHVGLAFQGKDVVIRSKSSKN